MHRPARTSVLLALVLAGCGGGGSSPTSGKTATPASNGVQLSPNPAMASVVGQKIVVTATQANYSGTFSVASQTCASSVATISPPTSATTFTITANGANNPVGAYCTFTIIGGSGMSAALQVGVTITGGTISVRQRNF